MPTAPYPLLSDALNSIRVQINDAIQGIGGQTLINTAAFTPYYVNRGYQMLQQELLNLGYVRLITQGFLLTNVPPAATSDATTQVSLSWTGYSDGVSSYPATALPQTLIKPLKLMERISLGYSPNPKQFWDMSGPEQGITRIPFIPKTFRNVIWVWDNDTIIMPGANNVTDLRVDFASYLGDFTTGSFPGNQVIPIMRSTDALAWYVAYVFSYARNDDPTVCSFALGEARRAAGIIAGMKQPTETMQMGVQ